MAFTGRVNLIKRKNKDVIHCGARICGKIASLCNGIWNCDDWVREGEVSEVTCKRCQAKLKRTDEKGVYRKDR